MYILIQLAHFFFSFLLLDCMFLVAICFFQTYSRNVFSVLFIVRMGSGEKDLLFVFRQLYYFILLFQEPFFQVTGFCLLIYFKNFLYICFSFFFPLCIRLCSKPFPSVISDQWISVLISFPPFYFLCIDFSIYFSIKSFPSC